MYLVAQHSESWNIAGRTIILQYFPFNLTYIFLLHKTPDDISHFSHLALILWYIPSLMSPVFGMIDLKYRKALYSETYLPSITIWLPIFLDSRSKVQVRYSVFEWLILKNPLLSMTSRHLFNFWFTPFVSLSWQYHMQTTYTKLPHLKYVSLAHPWPNQRGTVNLSFNRLIFADCHNI